MKEGDDVPGEVDLLVLLERRGLQQAQFAERMGVAPSMVSRWISGERRMTLERRLQAADVLHAPELAMADDRVRRVMRGQVVDLGIARQERAMAKGEPVRVPAVKLIYPDGRVVYTVEQGSGPDDGGASRLIA